MRSLSPRRPSGARASSWKNAERHGGAPWSGPDSSQPMSATPIQTKALLLVPQTREEVRASVKQMPPEAQATVSPEWLALLEGSAPCDPWIHGFVLIHRQSGAVVGRSGFKGPPTVQGVVEIA